MNYRSAVMHGFTSPIGNREEDKTEAFAQITERTIPGRWDHARKPTPTEYKGTAIIKVIIDSARYTYFCVVPVLTDPAQCEDPYRTSR